MQRERALENFDIHYFKNKPIINNSGGEKTNLNLHIEYHGKENYVCEVGESLNTISGMHEKFYICSKFNPERIKTKNIIISFIYTRVPNLPKELEPLAKEYTYEDLQRRSKRILDSLYIKDGWEK